MSDPYDSLLKKLIGKIHRRSLWRVLGICRGTTGDRRWRAAAIGMVVGSVCVGCGGGDPTSPDPNPEPQNRTPTANAGANQDVSVTLRVQLDGSGSSDPDGDPLTFRWSLASVPSGSTTALDNPTTESPSFVADLPGGYVVQLGKL